MDNDLMRVKNVFDSVKEMRTEIAILFESLDGRITKLKDVYNEFINNTKEIQTPDVKAFIFSLDSFYFQTSLLQKEHDYLIDYRNTIINRMYGEYYKLFKLIIEYIDKSHIDNKLKDLLKKKTYPRYDDLDDRKTYDFNLIVQLNEDILGIVNGLINILKDKERSLKQYTTNQDYGLNVNNFVSTYNYEVNVLQEQINLYEKYLEFFYNVHQKLLKRLITKISILEAQINADIKFEGGLLSKRKDNNELIAEMNYSGLNKKAAKELRKSLHTLPVNMSRSPSNSSSIISYHESDFLSIDNNHPSSSSFENLELPRSVRMSDTPVGLDTVASQIFKKHGVQNSDNEEDSITDEIPISTEIYEHDPSLNTTNRTHSDTLDNAHDDNDDNEDEDEDEDEDGIFNISDVSQNEIKLIIDECMDNIVETNITFDISGNNASLNGEQMTLTSKQKKYLKKRLKKKEKKLREQQEKLDSENILSSENVIA